MAELFAAIVSSDSTSYCAQNAALAFGTICARRALVLSIWVTGSDVLVVSSLLRELSLTGCRALTVRRLALVLAILRLTVALRRCLAVLEASVGRRSVAGLSVGLLLVFSLLLTVLRLLRWRVALIPLLRRVV